jgi:hypothetical protein
MSSTFFLLVSLGSLSTLSIPKEAISSILSANCSFILPYLLAIVSVALPILDCYNFLNTLYPLTCLASSCKGVTSKKVCTMSLPAKAILSVYNDSSPSRLLTLN